MCQLLSSNIMTRTTLDLDPSVLKELRRKSEREGKSMGAVASEVLARGLSETTGQSESPLAWTSRNLGVPLIDLEDKDAVQAALDAEA
jgi:hypothetical protein